MADGIDPIAGRIAAYAKLTGAKLAEPNLVRKPEHSAPSRSDKLPGYDALKQKQQAATDFEAMLLQDMLKSMWQTVPSEGMLTGSREEQTYRDMLNQALSKNIAEHKSLGIREVIMKEFDKREPEPQK